jgi:hypothetical protein
VWPSQLTRPQRWWKWADASRTNRRVALAGVVLLCYGTLLHIIQLLLSGVNFNGNLPAWAVVYFTALTLLDPLGAVLLAQARRSGLVFAVSILVTDSIANGWVNFVLDASRGITVGRIGSTLLTLIAVAALAVTPRLWRSRPTHEAALSSDKHSGRRTSDTAT